jgi:hypothetical protein
MPTTVPSSVATTSDHGATAAGNGVVHEMIFAPSSPSPMPSIAPRVLSVALSTRNWRRMSLRRAPSDFRTPISRVRSATATSMMFMITSPPTTRLMAGSAVPAIVMMVFVFSNEVSAEADVSMTKLSGVPGRSRRCPRITSRTVSIASSIITALGA